MEVVVAKLYYAAVLILIYRLSCKNGSERLSNWTVQPAELYYAIRIDKDESVECGTQGSCLFVMT